MDLTKLKENEKQVIKKAIEHLLMRLGIHTEILIEFGEKKLVLVSTPIQTTPTIYKEVKITGNGSLDLFNESRTDVFTLKIHLNYSFKYFGGGSNGVNLGVIEFRLFENENYVRIDQLGLTIGAYENCD